MLKRRGVLLILGLLALACTIPVPPIPTPRPITTVNPPVEETQTLGLEGANRAEVRLGMAAGDLSVRPADGVELLSAAFRYNVLEWKPVVKQQTQEQRTQVSINQGMGTQLVLGDLGDYVNSWTVGLAQGVPLDLGIELGTGKTQLELGGLSLSALSVTAGSNDLSCSFASPNPEPLATFRLNQGTGDVVVSGLGNANLDRFTFIGGAGTVDLDFAGAWTRAAIADLKAGAGKITVRVPATLGVRVVFAGTSVSSVEAIGFIKQEETVYVNPAYGVAPLTLTLNATTGVGTITLISQ